MALPRTYADLRSRVIDRGMWASIHARAAARSRVTNLGVVLLVSALIMSLLANIRSSGTRVVTVTAPQKPEKHAAFEMPRKDMPSLPSNVPNLRHLVVVAGHAIWNGQNANSAMKESDWTIEPYQRNSIKTFIKHINKGVEIATADPSALLIFSGGQTRPASLETEAKSYFRLATELNTNLPHFMGTDSASKSRQAFEPFDSITTTTAPPPSSGTRVQPVRMTTEDYARDSFENLLFSIARFREFSGTYPERITIVGYAYKQARFVDLHARAVRWPKSRLLADNKPSFTYVGIDDENTSADAVKHEHAIKYHQFEADMYGCHGKLLSLRRNRNPARRVPPYTASAPEIANLINWCPMPDSQLQGLFPGWLPWDPRVQGSGLGEGARSILDANGGRFITKDVLPDGKRIVY